MKVAVFSARLDPVHLGHINTISILAQKNDIVLVPILAYEGRKCTSAFESKDILLSVLHNCGTKNVFSCVNNIHFGKITNKEYCSFLERMGIQINGNKITYYSGNEEVLCNMKKEKIRYKFIPRSYDHIYSGTKIREGLGL